jgi:hypothetical protein
MWPEERKSVQLSRNCAFCAESDQAIGSYFSEFWLKQEKIER